MGGCDYGGYVNDAGQNNPTYEFYPSKGGPVGMNILLTTLPANLFPLIWLLPSGTTNSFSVECIPDLTFSFWNLVGNIFVQTNLGTEIFDYKNNIEYTLPAMPHAVRTYPGSAATAMMPLTPANNWTATILFVSLADPKYRRFSTPSNVPHTLSAEVPTFNRINGSSPGILLPSLLIRLAFR